MKSTLAGLLVLFSFMAYPQSNDSITYLNENGERVSKQHAVYYRKVSRAPEGYLIRDYFVENDQLEMEAYYSSLNPETRHGAYVSYFKNGAKREEGSYVQGERTGLWSAWFDNAQARLTAFHKKDEVKYLNAWDEAGTPVLHNGFGLIAYSHKKGKQYSEIRDSLLFANFIVSDSDTVFNFMVDKALPPGGFPQFYQGIAKVIKYPARARRLGIEGKVYVEFVVDRKGRISHPLVIKGISKECDEEAILAIVQQPPWAPAMYKGKPVDQKMVLPITFKLGD